jgi:PAS domain-containing protein
VLVLRGQAATNELLAREEALRRSEAFLAGTQRISKTGSFSFKSPSGEMYWSDEAARIYGYPLDLAPTMERCWPIPRRKTAASCRPRWTNRCAARARSKCATAC